MQIYVGPAELKNSLVASYGYATRYYYPKKAVHSNNLLHLTPLQGQRQSDVRWVLWSRPAGTHVSYTDRFGNPVVRLRIPSQHEHMVLAITGSARITPGDTVTGDAGLSSYAVDIEDEQYLMDSPLVHSAPLAERARSIAGSATGVLEIVQRVVDWVHGNIEYLRGHTDVTTDAQTVLEIGRGVCQDQTHLVIGFLRSLGIPARYVSGVLTNVTGETHAWTEFLHPSGRWLDADATAGKVQPTRTGYIKFAIGRDYTDVPPINGDFVSTGAGGIDKVAVTASTTGLVSVQQALALIGEFPEDLQ